MKSASIEQCVLFFHFHSLHAQWNARGGDKTNSHHPQDASHFIRQKRKFQVNNTSTGMSIFAKLTNVLVLNKILTAKTAFSNHKWAHLSHSGVDRTFCYALSSYWRHAVSRKWHGHWITKLWMCVSQLKLHRTKLCEIILNIYQLIRWKKRECFYRRRSVVAPKKDLVLNK